ncbi:MAG: response regulator transcription factor [Spirochaetales bacterium]|nr:response regulator transcription factor [Spirochaetales bacterium]
MRVLFVGNEEEYARKIQHGENDTSFSLFFTDSCAISTARPDPLNVNGYDAVLIPALCFVSLPSCPVGSPVIATGPGSLAEACFEAGCHDYIREPWTTAELDARVRAASNKELRLSDGRVVIRGNKVYGPSGSACLSGDSKRVLALLAANTGKQISRDSLYAVIGTEPLDGRSMDMRIARLRTLLRGVGAPDVAERLRCEHGSYTLVAASSERGMIAPEGQDDGRRN